MRESGLSKQTAESKRREMLQKRVEELTQPIAEHEIAELDLDTRQGFTRRSGSIVMVAVVLLAAIVGAVLGIRMLTGGDADNSAGGAAGTKGTHALSVPVNGRAGGEDDPNGQGAGSHAGGADGLNANPTQTESGAPHDHPKPDSGAGNGIIVVSVQGMVAHPGLLRVKDDLRVGDVVTLAGPIHPRARLHGVNLAQKVRDGLQIVVDAKGSRLVMPVAVDGEAPLAAGAASPDGAEGSDASGSAGAASPPANATQGKGAPGETTPGTGAAGGKVNINTADQTALETLSGVGPATAKAIIEWRTTNGKFRSIEQLMEVRGIGPAKFAAMKDAVTV